MMMDGYVKIIYPYHGVKGTAVAVALGLRAQNAIRATENIRPARLGDPH